MLHFDRAVNGAPRSAPFTARIRIDGRAVNGAERGLEVDTISARLASTGSKIPPKAINVSRISPQKKVHIPIVFWAAVF